MSVYVVAYGPIRAPTDSQIYGEYLKSYDPDANGGGGEATFTKDIREAIAFASIVSALEHLDRVPSAKPVREDGKANKPIYAFHIEFVFQQSEA